MTTKAKRSPAAELPSQPTTTVEADLPQAVRFSSASPSTPAKKSAQVIALLEAEGGGTLADMCAVSGWQPHSSRAFLTGLRKKGRLLERSHRSDGVSVYILVPGEPAAQ